MVKDPIIIRNPFQLPPRTFWNLKVDINRNDVPKLCEGLHLSVHEKHGACYYYPNIEKNNSEHRYEWQIPYNQKNYGIILGITFIINIGNLDNICIYAAYGDESENYRKIPDFTEKEKIFFYNEIMQVIQNAFKLVDPTKFHKFHVVFYLDLPPGYTISKKYQIQDHDIIILPTVINKKETKRVSAVIVTVNSSILNLAKSLALREVTKFCALLTIGTGAFFSLYQVIWPNDKSIIEYIDSLQEIPSNSKLYPTHKYVRDSGQHSNEFSDIIKIVLDIFNGYDNKKKDILTNQIFAYYSSKEISTKHPTLSTVALLTSISPLVKPKKCNGSIHCTKCGKLKIKHNIHGEREEIFNKICEILNLSNENDYYSKIDRLVKRIYNEHRSAFVHGAYFRHDEYHRNFSLPKAIPTSKKPFSDSLIFRNDLLSFDLIVRRVLLKHITESSGFEFKPETFYFDSEKLLLRSKFEISSVIPVNTIIKMVMKP